MMLFIRTFAFLILASFLFACDLKPIDYSKKRRKSSYVSASTTQTRRLRKAHARKSISRSKRAFKNRLNSRSYYNRNKNRRKLRKGIDPICQTILPFLSSTLINNFLTVSISSALLDATNSVKLANASLLMIE